MKYFKSPLSFRELFFLTVIALLAASTVLLHSGKEKQAQALFTCNNDRSIIESEAGICHRRLERYYEQYGSCDESNCLFANPQDVQGYFTFTAEIIEQKKVPHSQPLCTRMKIVDATPMSLYLLEERIGKNPVFITYDLGNYRKGDQLTITSLFPALFPGSWLSDEEGCNGIPITILSPLSGTERTY